MVICFCTKIGNYEKTNNSSIYDIPQNARYVGLLGTGRLDAYAAVKKACSVDLIDETISSATEIDGCFISVRNSVVNNNSSLVLDSTQETVINNSFEVLLGSTLEIK